MGKVRHGTLTVLLAALLFQPVMGDEGDDEPCDPVGPFGYPGLQLPADEIGEWAPWQILQFRAIHSTLLHTGQVLIWSGKELDIGDPTPSFLWDPATQELEALPLVDAELFCAGHSTLADGRLLAVGGTALEGIGWGPKHNAIFDPKTKTWTRVADMGYGRYYPTATTLGDGRVLAVSGNIHPAIGEVPTLNSDIPELYDAATDTWIQFEDAQFGNPMYPMNFLVPDGRMLFAGPSIYAKFLDLAAQSWSPAPYSQHTNANASTAMYEPGKVLKIGGSMTDASPSLDMAEALDLTEPSPAWYTVDSMEFARSFTNLVLLPDGSALVVGGSQSHGWFAECAVHAAELWDPETEMWTTMASMERPRMYHATALLLPDGRVLVAGGENADIGGEITSEIYSPPYLFHGPRPGVDFAPGHIGYGDAFTIDSPDASSIAKVSILRPGSVTHSFDQNGRYVPLAFGAAGSTLTVQAPAHSNLAPPGYYMLVLVNDQGVPSVAEWVKLGDCTATQNDESSCEDGVDNDCDGLPDAADPDCGVVGEIAPAGAVPDLLLDKAGPSHIKLEWGTSCDAGDQDYAIYEGVLGEYGDHIPVVCSTNGTTTWTFGRMGSHYYLAVPNNGLREGSYGVDYSGVERPASALGCLPQEIGTCF